MAKAYKDSFKVNQSFYNKLEHLEALALTTVKERLEDIAQTAVAYSPSDTGAYVTSFSFTAGAGRPRGKSSKNKPKGVDKRQEGYDNLMQDLTRFKSIEDLDTVELRNGSPHQYDVEFGESWRRDGYYVFTKLRSIYG